MFALQCLDERGQDGHGGVDLHCLHALGSPETHPDEEDGAADEGHVVVVFFDLSNLTEVEHGRVAEVCGQEGAGDPPGLLAVVLDVDDATKRADERGQRLAGDIAESHDGVETLEKKPEIFWLQSF